MRFVSCLCCGWQTESVCFGFLFLCGSVSPVDRGWRNFDGLRCTIHITPGFSEPWDDLAKKLAITTATV